MKNLPWVIATFVLLLIIQIFLRQEYGANIKIEPIEIVIAIIPILIWMILTNKAKVIEFGGFKIETAFAEATKSGIAANIIETKLPVDPVRMNSKEGLEDLPKVLENRPEALVFTLGRTGYYDYEAVREYLKELSSSLPSFEHIIINENDGKFFGVADARAITSIFAGIGEKYYQLAESINNSDIEKVKSLPGFVSKEDAIRKTALKKEALDKIEKTKTEKIPVIDDSDKFVGFLDRSKLLANMILEISKKVQPE